MYFTSVRATGVLLISLLYHSIASAADDTACRCFPGDSCWPSEEQWTALNQTLDGRLIKSEPIASVCHTEGTAYDEQSCAQLRDVWQFPSTHDSHSTSVMAPAFANASCDPFSGKDEQCVVGAYPPYVVNATGASDYQMAIKFAETNNIRLVIRNTAHDYLGKSTGAGALSIWTHHLKSIEFLDYKSSSYSGKAAKFGAGVQVREAYEAAHKEGLVIVGGNEGTVGLAGGYSQGGGHGPLASRFGLAADQVLEWEVVTGTGDVLKASPSENPDLYWALSGGGGGTYGVVLSMMVKAYPDEPTVAANLTVIATGQPEHFWDVVSTFIDKTPGILDDGGKADWFLIPQSPMIFVNMPTIGFGLTKTRLEEFFQPILAKLTEYDLMHMFHIEEFPTFLEAFDGMVPKNNVSNFQMGGRLMPRSTVTSNLDGLTSTLQSMTDKGAIISGVNFNVSKKPGTPSNSVLPAWRHSVFSAVFGLPWDDENWERNLEVQKTITDVLVPELHRVAPDGAYLSEADFREPEWQRMFYGENYERLLAIKQRYDPNNMFYAVTAVGSEYWEEIEDKRLCKSNRAGKIPVEGAHDEL